MALSFKLIFDTLATTWYFENSIEVHILGSKGVKKIIRLETFTFVYRCFHEIFEK